MELIRLEFQSFRDFAETAWPGLGRDGLWAPPGAPLPEGLAEVRLEVGLAEGSPLLRGVVRVEPEEETGRIFLRFLELDRPSRVLLERIEAKHGHPITVGPAAPAAQPEAGSGRGPVAAEPTAAGTQWTVAEALPSRADPARAQGEAAPAGPTPAEAHTLEELADLLSREQRREALAETQRIPGPELDARSGTVESSLSGDAPPVPVPAPAPAVAAEPAPLPPYLGGPEPAHPGRRVVVVRSPWLWIAVVLGLLVGAWELGRLLRTSDAPPATGARDAVSSVATPVAGERAADAAFDRVEGMDWESGETSTVVTVRVNGAIARERWSTERVAVGAMREVLTLHGVEVLPEVARVEVGDGRIVRVRAGLHRGPEGESLQVIAELADAGVRLAGVDVGDRALRLVFVSG